MSTRGRVVLREWRDDDLESFAILNADPVVMASLPGTLDRAASDALAGRIRADLERRGWGLWAVEIPDRAPFAGFVGLSVPSFDAHFTPTVEVGWRLSRDLWGHGYATEAARLALRYGFDVLGIDEIVSFTARTNTRSISVMERLGMHNDPDDDFDHPTLGPGHHLRRHVLYRMTRRAWHARGVVTPHAAGSS